MASSTLACPAAAKPSAEIPEVPAGCDQEEQLLQALTAIPLMTKAIARPDASSSGQRVDITVGTYLRVFSIMRMAQHTPQQVLHVTVTICVLRMGGGCVGDSLPAGAVRSLCYMLCASVCLPAQVLASQHNLPANSKRSLQYDVFVPNPAHPDQVGLFVTFGQQQAQASSAACGPWAARYKTDPAHLCPALLLLLLDLVRKPWIHCSRHHKPVVCCLHMPAATPGADLSPSHRAAGFSPQHCVALRWVSVR